MDAILPIHDRIECYWTVCRKYGADPSDDDELRQDIYWQSSMEWCDEFEQASRLGRLQAVKEANEAGIYVPAEIGYAVIAGMLPAEIEVLQKEIAEA